MIPESKPAIILTGWRTGGTFLSHCLSNHPDIFCARGEPMHYKNVWRKTAKPPKVLDCIWSQPHYAVGCCKLSYTQAFEGVLWPYLVKKQPKIIWLYRENVIRQAVSFLLTKQKDRPQHVMTSNTKPDPIKFEPAVIVNTARKMQKYNKWAKERVKNFEQVLKLSYAEIIGSEKISVAYLHPVAQAKICEFLGVPDQQMYSGLRKVNHYPLRKMLTNWPIVEKAIKASEFAALLKDEW